MQILASVSSVTDSPLPIFVITLGEDGKKHVPITIHFRSVDIVTVPDEEEIIAAMEEIRNNPTKVS